MHARRRSAFTLVEILIVVVIIGVAAAMVVPSMLSAGTLGLQGAARLIVADIQYAQNEAVATGQERGIEFQPLTNRYRMFDQDGATIDLAWMRVGGRADAVPGDGSGHTVDFNEDARFKGFDLRGVRDESVNLAENQQPFEIRFDELGAPIGDTADVELYIAFRENVYRVVIDGFTGRVSVE